MRFVVLICAACHATIAAPPDAAPDGPPPDAGPPADASRAPAVTSVAPADLSQGLLVEITIDGARLAGATATLSDGIAAVIDVDLSAEIQLHTIVPIDQTGAIVVTIATADGSTTVSLPVTFITVESSGDDGFGRGTPSAPYATIGRALQQAGAGSTIAVGAGDFDEDGLVLDPGETLAGAGTSTMIHGSSGAVLTLQGNSGGTFAVSDLSIDGACSSGILVLGNQLDAMIDRVSIDGCTNDIDVDSTQGTLQLHGDKLTGASSAALTIDGPRDEVTIDTTTIDGGLDGIVAPASLATTLTVTGSTLTNAADAEIDVPPGATQGAGTLSVDGTALDCGCTAVKIDQASSSAVMLSNDTFQVTTGNLAIDDGRPASSSPAIDVVAAQVNGASESAHTLTGPKCELPAACVENAGNQIHFH